MVKQALTYLIILFIAPFLIGCGEPDGGRGLPVQPLTIETQSGQVHEFEVELALTQEEMAVGLMFRKDMDDNKGMLFYFGQEREINFWMKNTFIPLDMIFIRADGIIHHIHENAVPEDLTPIPSQGEVMGVLEINAGLSKKLGIQPGDLVNQPLFGN